LLELPNQRVFAATAANHKNFHRADSASLSARRKTSNASWR
jgi:hypothetical protein